jgi:hypothetical protein
MMRVDWQLNSVTTLIANGLLPARWAFLTILVTREFTNK